MINNKVQVICSVCHIEWMKQKYDLKKWLGKCKSCAKIGNTVASFNKDKPKSEQHREKISIALTGKTRSTEHCLNISKAKTGAKMPDSFKQKLSDRMKGANNHFYIDGRTPENNRIRHSLEYKEWRTSVFQRDNYTCKLCSKRGNGDMHVDHIKPFAYYPELRFSMDNGRTLCAPCHRSTDTYGKKCIQNYQLIN